MPGSPRPRAGRRGLELELHLDVAARIEFELARRERRAVDVARTDRRELDDDPLIALDQGVDEQLVGSRLELEMLERIDVQGDRQRREVGRRLLGIEDDALHPAGAVVDDLAAAQIAVGHGLLEQRTEQVEHVRSARHDAVIDEELGGGRARHPASPRWAEGDAAMVQHGPAAEDPFVAARRSRVRTAGRVSSTRCCSPSTSATRTSPSACSGPARCSPRAAPRRTRGRRPTRSSCCSTGCCGSTGSPSPTSTPSRSPRSCRR